MSRLVPDLPVQGRLASLAVAAALAAGACASGTPTASPSAPSAPSVSAPASVVPATPDASITGTVAVWSWESGNKELQVNDEAFKAVYPGITVTYETHDDAATDVQMAAAAGAPSADVIIVRYQEAQQLIANGILADLTDRVGPVKDQMAQSLWIPFTADGRVYGTPRVGAPVGIFYNADTFAAAGVDPASIETWDDFYQAAKTIKEKTGGTITSAPKAQASYWWDLMNTMISQQGLAIVDEAGKVIIDTDPRWLATLEYLGKLWSEDLVADYVNDSDAFFKGLADGTIASYYRPPWYRSNLANINPEGAGHWGVMKLPAWEAGGARASTLGGHGFGIPATSENQDAAWAYVSFHLSGEAQLAMASAPEFSNWPANVTINDDPFFTQPDPYFADQAVNALFAEVNAEAPVTNIWTPDLNQMIDIINPELQKFALGQQTAQEALTNAANAIRADTGRE